MRVRTVVLTTLVLVAAPAAAQPAAAEVPEGPPGTFWLDDGDTGDRWELVLRDAVAYRTFEEYPGGTLTIVSVVLASQPVNRDRMRAELGGEDDLWHTHGPHLKVDLCERDRGWTACGLHVQLLRKSISGSVGDDDIVESLTVSGDRVQARFATGERLTFFDDRYGFEATIDLPIETFD